MVSKIYNIQNIFISCLFCVLTCYFGYFAIYGEKGFITTLRLTKKMEKLQEKLDRTRMERLELEHRVNLLKSDSLDVDLLDERARQVLGFAKKTELMMVID